MKLLKLAERLDDIVVLGKLLGRLAEGLLGLKVLLEVEVTQVAVDLHHVVEFLDIELVGVVQVTELGGRNRADLSPTVLKLTESGECGINILLFLHKVLKILDDSLLPGEVLLPLGILPAVIFSALFLIVGIDTLESGLNGLERIVLNFIRMSRRYGLLDHILPR